MVSASESAQALAFVLLVLFLGYVVLILVPFLKRKPNASGDPAAFQFHVLIAARDEEAVIGATIARLRASFAQLHIWVIDDDSDDKTGSIVAALQQRDEHLHLVSRRRPNARIGKGEALNAAYRAMREWIPAEVDPSSVIVLVIDADGTLAPNALEQAAGPTAFADPTTGAAQVAVWMSNRDDPNPRSEGGRAANALGRYLVRMQDIEFRTTIAAMQSLRGHTASVGLGGNGQFVRFSVLNEIAERTGSPWHGSLLEDYELGVHVMLAGHRTVYLHDTHVEQEAVPVWRRLLIQRVRWCQGGMQCTQYLGDIFRSRNFSNAGALEATYFLLMPFVQLLGVVLWPTVFITMVSQGAARSGSLLAWAAESWWLLPLIALTGIVPFVLWPVIYRRQCAPEASVWKTLGWSLGYWVYMYQTYICVVRALWRLITGKNGWAKTRRNAERSHLATVEA
ncbi:glycosyltransferase family 2 protein [Humidisolicoccus flavus]|uniref:glycosyltransferase family 2 protein n=1 Tax=Humidisolicoccus flavus TaxID=3111414 RepID=UPI00324AE26E